METKHWSDAVSPSHYKEIVPGYEYMDMMVHMLKDMDGVEAHLMGQAYKYLMRYGKKDNKIQELGKVRWYVDYLMKHLEQEEKKQEGLFDDEDNAVASDFGIPSDWMRGDRRG